MIKSSSNQHFILLFFLLALLAAFANAVSCHDKCPQKETCVNLPCPVWNNPFRVCQNCWRVNDVACLAARDAACRIGQATQALKDGVNAAGEGATHAINEAQNQLSRAIRQFSIPNVNNQINNIRANLESQARHLAVDQLTELRNNLKSAVVSAVMVAFPAINAVRLAALAAAIGQASGDILVVKTQLIEVINAAHKSTPEFVGWVRTRAPAVLGSLQSHSDNAFHNFVTSPISDFLNVSDIVTPTKTVFDNVIGYIRTGVDKFNSAAAHGDQVVAAVQTNWVNKLETDLQQQIATAAEKMIAGMLGKAALGI